VVGFAAFVCFGIFIGTLIGLTADSVVSGFLPILFAFGGGSIIALMGTLQGDDRRTAFIAVGALSIGGLLGVYSSVYIAEYQILTPSEYRFRLSPPADTSVDIAARRYLREIVVPEIDLIDQQVRSGLREKAQAYDDLIAIVRRP
jgi:hypothetical protein